MFSILNTYKQGKHTCYGLVLWKSATKHVEMWLCPANFEIERHSHPKENIELMYVFGSKATFHRTVNMWPNAQDAFKHWKDQHFTPKWYNFLQRFTVSAGVVHWFTVSKWPLIFINFSTFLPGHKAESASKDFKKV